MDKQSPTSSECCWPRERRSTKLLRQARSRLAKTQSELGDAGTSLAGSHGQQEAAYQELVKHDAALRGQAAERSNLEKMKNDLLAKQRERDALIEKQAALQRERTQLLQKLSELRDRSLRGASIDRPPHQHGLGPTNSCDR